MIPPICVIDTNVVVAGLISADTGSPPALVLDAMLAGSLAYLMSAELLDEYSRVLQRARLVKRHRLAANEIDLLLTELVANAMWREPLTAPRAPDAGDNHLWALLAAQPGCRLVTGDRRLIEDPPEDALVVSARDFVDSFLSQN